MFSAPFSQCPRAAKELLKQAILLQLEYNVLPNAKSFTVLIAENNFSND